MLFSYARSGLTIVLAIPLACAAASNHYDFADASEPLEDSSVPAKDGASSLTEDAGNVDSAVDAHGDDHFVWPDCTSLPANVSSQTISDIWTSNPTQPTEVWLHDVFVTAISKGACAASMACDIYLQQDETYVSLASGAHHGIKVFVSAATSMYFTNINVSDKLDVLGWAYRYSLDGSNELLVQVDQLLPGCAHKTGTGSLSPIVVSLGDLTVDAGENSVGPLLVEVDNVRGTPGQPTQTFGLGNEYFDGGAPSSDIVSLSPYFLAGASFTGLTSGSKTTFTSITGTFGLFVRPSDASVAKYIEIYPRTAADIQR